MKNSQQLISQRHFTIAEVMMVVAICIVVLAISMSAWINPGQQTRLKNAVRLVSNQLSLARAKAVAERKEIGVFFNKNTAQSTNFAMIVCEEGLQDQYLQGEQWVHLPGNIIFTTTKPTAAAQVMEWPTASKDRSIIFRADGSIAADSSTELETFYLVMADHSNSIKDENATHYYKIQLNKFTGRYKITLLEIE